ncbi:19095_t:CDS:1, partial [Gigaspora rosea]
MEHIEQENVTDLGDSDFGLEENPSSNDFFVRQTKKRASTSKDTVKKKKKSSQSTTNTLAETLSTKNIPEKNNNQVTSNASSETGLSTNQQPSKPDLKCLQLVPINKVPGNSWIWSYYQLYKPVQPYKRIVSCLVEVNKNNRTYQC